MALIGYARVSTEYQSLDTQIEALQQAGCYKVFAENASGGNRQRVAFRECLDYLRPGDKLLVYHTNRLARDTLFTLEILEQLDALGVEMESLMDPIDTKTPAGKCMMTVTAAIATMEREQNSLIVRDRLARARARGTVLGRKRKIALGDHDRLRMLVQLHAGSTPIPLIEQTMQMHNSTIYRNLALAKKLGYYPEYQPKSLKCTPA
jgi:DNA invertase Pin-like site-specific DNA recombinase